MRRHKIELKDVQMLKRSTEYYQSLLREFIKLPTEVEWIEFKVNNKDPERIAK